MCEFENLDIVAFGGGLPYGYVSAAVDTTCTLPRGRVVKMLADGRFEVEVVGLLDIPTGELRLEFPQNLSMYRDKYDSTGWWW